ncbi:MAG: cytochrome c, partial [Mariniphaga sp.]|nr:cytochrome c [Mariniphaga sp.]
MHRLIFLITLFWILFPSISINAQSSGEGLYKADCSACHTINGGRLIGPDLAGINELREQSWLISFIRSSQKMIKSGDSLAVAIYNEYSKLPMPDHNWSDEQIISVLNYIRETEDPLLTQAAAEKQVPDSAL